MIRILTTLVFLLAAFAIPAMAGEADLRKFVYKGMTESEVIAKIGSPDSTSTVNGSGSEDVEQIWTYLPAGRDAQVITTIKLKNGVVQKVDRIISR